MGVSARGLLCVAACWLAIGAVTPALALAQHASDASSTPEIDALLAGLEARYANAASYRDVGYALWLASRERFGNNDNWGEWTLGFERRATPVDGESPSVSSDLRWLVEERHVGKWGAASLRITWADGLDFRTWSAKSESRGSSTRGVGALERDWELLPLRLAVRAQTGLRDPFLPLAHRTSLGEAEVNGARCHGVELREDARASTGLRLWIAADDHSLRRLEHGGFGDDGFDYHTEITYHPRFDEALPASALAYDPPWFSLSFELRPFGAGFSMLCTGAMLLITGLVWLRRRRPWLLGQAVFVLMAVSFQAWPTLGETVAWLRLPAELHGRVGELPWFRMLLLASMPVCLWFLARGEWGSVGVSAKRLRAAVEALVERGGGRVEWSPVRRWFGTREAIELPGSRLRAELRKETLTLHGASGWGERRRWRHALEQQLLDDGLVITQAVPGIMTTIGATLVAVGVAAQVL